MLVWDNLKENDIVTEKNFLQFFCDISCCVESDEHFSQILKGW